MDLTAAVEYVTIIDGLLDFAIAALVYAELRRLGAGTSRAGAALLAFFLFSGLHELTERGPVLPYSPTVDLVMTLGLAAALVAMLPLGRSLARGLVESRRRADHEAREYERASRHYEQLVRHRLFNPLAVVQGAAQTLKSVPDIEPADRAQLLESIIEAANRIEAVSLQTAQDGIEERELHAKPRLDGS